MSNFLDGAAKRSNARVIAAGRRSAVALEAEIIEVAKGIAHHGPVDLIEVIRQRCRVAIDPNWADEICRRYGWSGQKRR